MYLTQTSFPDIFTSNELANPTILSPNAFYSISFAFNKEASYDLEAYKALIDSAVREFRHSRTYSHYKAYLLSLGLNCCQFHPHIQTYNDTQVASIEMHHCMLTIHDIAFMIAEHYLNLGQALTEFDISEILRTEHIENHIPITMLCKTCHQTYHHKYLYIHPEMIFGKWWELFDRYKLGLTRDIAYKVMIYLEQATKEKFEKKKEIAGRLLELCDKIKVWENSCSIQ